MKFLEYLLGGRPMLRVGYGFPDQLTGKPVYIWMDCFGRYWMAMNKWGYPRASVPMHEDLLRKAGFVR